jgi:hypothetical protein
MFTAIREAEFARNSLIAKLSTFQSVTKGIIPNRNRFSSLFRKMMPHIVFMNDLRGKLEYGGKHGQR